MLSTSDIQTLCLEYLFWLKITSGNFGCGWEQDVNSIRNNKDNCFLTIFELEALLFSQHVVKSFTLFLRKHHKILWASLHLVHVWAQNICVALGCSEYGRERIERSKTCNRNDVFDFDSLCSLYNSKWKINSHDSCTNWVTDMVMLLYEVQKNKQFVFYSWLFCKLADTSLLPLRTSTDIDLQITFTIYNLQLCLSFVKLPYINDV